MQILRLARTPQRPRVHDHHQRLHGGLDRHLRLDAGLRRGAAELVLLGARRDVEAFDVGLDAARRATWSPRRSASATSDGDSQVEGPPPPADRRVGPALRSDAEAGRATAAAGRRRRGRPAAPRRPRARGPAAYSKPRARFAASATRASRAFHPVRSSSGPPRRAGLPHPAGRAPARPSESDRHSCSSRTRCREHAAELGARPRGLFDARSRARAARSARRDLEDRGYGKDPGSSTPSAATRSLASSGNRARGARDQGRLLGVPRHPVRGYEPPVCSAVPEQGDGM